MPQVEFAGAYTLLITFREHAGSSDLAHFVNDLVELDYVF